MNIQDKVCLVTGGVRGIGKEIVIALLKNGAKHVTVLDVNKDLGNELIAEVGKQYGESKLSFTKADVTNAKDIEGVFQKIIKTFQRFDILINNAGVASEHDFEKMISVNLTSIIRSTHLGIKYMSQVSKVVSEMDRPTILNVASASAFLDFSLLPEYSATKAGVISFVRGIGTKEQMIKTGVRIVCLCPGYTPGTNLFGSGFSEEFKSNEEAILKDEKSQPVESVGRATIEMLKKADTGSIWVVDGGDLYKVKSPYISTCTELIKSNI